MSYNTKNYTEQGGAKTVIGGTLEIKSDATVTGPVVPDAGATVKGVVKQAANVAASSAEDVAGCVTSINAILTALKNAGIMAADAEV